MLNIQKYENEILSEYRDISCDYMTDCNVYELLYSVASKHNKEVNNNWGLKSLLDWFLQEYQEPMLNEKEKEYLSAVIKPFRNQIVSIGKYYFGREEELIIALDRNVDYTMIFPAFEAGTMYKGMQINKEYTLEELGL